MSATEVSLHRPRHEHRKQDMLGENSSAHCPRKTSRSFCDGAEEAALLSGLDSAEKLEGAKGLLAEFKSALDETLTKFSDLLKELRQNSDAGTKPESEETVPSASTSEEQSGLDEPRQVLSFAEREKDTLAVDEDGLVTEAELRRGVVSYALYFKDASLGEEFDRKYSDALKMGFGEQVALELGLTHLIESGKFPHADANWLLSLSHRAADFDTTAPDTIAVSGGIARDAAIRFAEDSLAGIQSGAVKVPSLSL